MKQALFFAILFTILTLSAQDSAAQKAPEGMALIPGGTFMMGIDTKDLDELVRIGKKVPHMNLSHAEGWYGDERPRHSVNVEPFYLDKYEVTNRQYARFVKETGYSAEGEWQKHAGADRIDQPVIMVTYNDAAAYAKWAGKRLPTEAEWEYAAKGGKDVKWFPWGNDPDPSKANYRSQGESFFDGIARLIFGRDVGTKKPGSYPPNGYGLYDMTGNVSEWCADTYRAYPGLRDEDWTDVRRNPFKTDPAAENQKIVRGGNWDSSNPVFIRLTNRKGFSPEYSSYSLGFRCAKPVE